MGKEHAMFFDAELVVHDCAHLAEGDQIDTWKDGQYLYAGTVTDVLPAKGLLWIREHSLNERRLLDICEFQVIPVAQLEQQKPNYAA